MASLRDEKIMTLNAGEKLGVYKILSPLGAGGMGEVYRARDTKLGREVAIKVLPEEFTQHPQKLARFEREAKLLASLNHPGIATLYGVEEVGSPQPERSAERSGVAEREAVGVGPRGPERRQPFLVMELVEGQTLADRISGGPIPVSEALTIAQQIAEALEAAHEKGVIHRDLKPANVKVDPEGKVKVLDFGLAKLAEAEGEDSGEGGSQSPTLSRDSTRAGMILGTTHYMSPEQAKGKTVDKRTDVFSYGIVLHEMLTGKKAFAGENAAEVLANIINKEPDWKAIPSGLDPRIQSVLSRCLRKDRKRRLQAIADVRVEIEDILAQPKTTSETVKARAPVLAWGLSLLVTALLGGFVVWSATRPESPPQAVMRFPLTLPPGNSFSSFGRHLVALSPDGTRLVYGANGQLYLREMDQLEAVPIRGTDGGREPFFSPDGQWIGFWADGQLRKIPATGGVALALCEANNPYGASWGVDGTIVFGQSAQGIFRVPAAGGAPETLIPMDAEKNERGAGPQMLPDGQTLLFSLATTPTWDEAQIVTQNLETGERRVHLEGGTDARYVPTGHLVYALGGTLLAVPFDLARLTVTGPRVPVLEGVGRAPDEFTRAAHASFSDSGTLVYVPEASLPTSVSLRELVWVDRGGNASPLTETLGNWETPRFSPDGQRLAVRDMDETGQQDVWLLELSRGTLQRLTFEDGLRPLWSPDGKTIFFSSLRAGQYNIFSKASDGSGGARQLTAGATFRVPASITSDGRTLVFRQGGDAGTPDLDIGMLDLEESGEPEVLIQTPFNEHTPKLSPNDQWLAYVSNESGRDEIYVIRFPAGGKWQISTEGGREPMWSKDGRELFYRNGEKMMVVAIGEGQELSPGRPALLFERPYDLKEGSGASNYDVAPDGTGFVMIRAPEGSAELSGVTQQINVVLNWFEELKRRVPQSD